MYVVCVMSLWLFNVYVDGLGRVLNAEFFRKCWNCSVKMVASLRYTNCYLQMMQH